MSVVDSLPAVSTVEAAITRVLAAERNAREATAEATRDAEARDELARADARALTERTERRIRKIHAAVEARISAEVAAIENQCAVQDESSALAPEDLRRVELAVAAVAAELTCGP
jgi:hypothetical protein